MASTALIGGGLCHHSMFGHDTEFFLTFGYPFLDILDKPPHVALVRGGRNQYLETAVAYFVPRLQPFGYFRNQHVYGTAPSVPT